MSHARTVDRPISIAEFDAFLEAQPDDDTIWELVDGRIMAMTNPNATHRQLALNIGAALKTVSEVQGCRVNVGGMRVLSPSDLSGIDKTVPDVVVRCGAWDGRKTWIDDPVMIVEILSPSTMDFNRGGKLMFYKSLETLVDIVIVYQDQVRVEHYRREGGTWAIHVLTVPTDRLVLSGIVSAMQLSDIYAGTELS